MLVVADKTMVDFYNANDHGGVEKYVLTIVNMVRVSQIWLHGRAALWKLNALRNRSACVAVNHLLIDNQILYNMTSAYHNELFMRPQKCGDRWRGVSCKFARVDFYFRWYLCVAYRLHRINWSTARLMWHRVSKSYIWNFKSVTTFTSSWVCFISVSVDVYSNSTIPITYYIPWIHFEAFFHIFFNYQQ